MRYLLAMVVWLTTNTSYAMPVLNQLDCYFPQKFVVTVRPETYEDEDNHNVILSSSEDSTLTYMILSYTNYWNSMGFSIRTVNLLSKGYPVTELTFDVGVGDYEMSDIPPGASYVAKFRRQNLPEIIGRCFIL